MRRSPSNRALTEDLDARPRPAASPGADLDNIDHQLLTLLAEDARRAYADLAQEVGMSPPAVYARVKKLEERGVIRAYTIVPDPVQLGYHLAAWVAVRQLPACRWEDLESAFQALPQVEACYSVTGDETYILLVRVADPRSLEDLLREINSLDGVSSTRTLVILSTTFERRRIS